MYYVFGLYYKLRTKSLYRLFVSSLKANTLNTLLTISLAFYFRQFSYPRSVILISWASSLILVFIWRVIIKLILGAIMGEDYLVSKALIIGDNPESHKLKVYLERDAQEKTKVLDIVPADQQEHIENLLRKQSPDLVILMDHRLSKKTLISIHQKIFRANPHCEYFLSPEVFESTMGELTREGNIRFPSVVGIIDPYTHQSWYPALKRIMDISISIVGLALFSLIFPLLAILIKLTSPGPIIYRQERIGLYGKRFFIYKLRTMYKDAEKEKPQWARENDERITVLGKFLRKTRLDEFPQLVNVLKNEMSLIGPRPERPYFAERLSQQLPFFWERLKIKPGITGWAQINYPYADSLEDYKEKLLLDLFYIRNMSPTLDIYILLKTFWIILKGEGAY